MTHPALERLAGKVTDAEFLKTGNVVLTTEDAAAVLAIALGMADNRPLDPEPWVVHSMDSGDVRFEREADCWGGYRANFEPRTELGYTDSRGKYRG